MAAFKLLLFAAVICMSMRTGLSADYYTVSRKDFRKCAAPLCGGYYLKKVNTAPETYIYAIRTDSLPLSVQAAYKKFVQQFPDKFDLIVYGGKLIRNAQSVKLNLGVVYDLSVTSIFLGYPGVSALPGKGVGYYSVASVSKGLVKASFLSTNKFVYVPTASVKTLDTALVDQGAQRNQILYKGAIVLASATASTALIKQVYFKLPVTVNPNCPLVNLSCNKPDKVVFTRKPDFCFLPTCLKASQIGVCPLSIPVCSEGYKLAGWPSLNRGCPAYVCDPVFFPTATKLDFN